MGMPKRDHIAAMMAELDIADPLGAASWRKAWSEAEIDRVYEVFVPMNEKVVAKYATLVPGGKEAIDALRGMGLKIGSTTGYTRSIMANVLPVAADQGYEPDNLVCSDDLIEGRPGPLGIYQVHGRSGGLSTFCDHQGG
jgi:phosphonoacetaldehyde hydrolase